MANELIEAAQTLLKAREEMGLAALKQCVAEEAFREAEAAYIKAHGAGEYPKNVLLGETLIMPRDEWYDLKEGTRFEYHTVQVRA